MEYFTMKSNELLNSFKHNIRKMKIDSFLENGTILTTLDFDISRHNKKYNNIARFLSKYGCLTGSYLYSSLGLINRTTFKDLDLIVNTENYNILKENYNIQYTDFYIDCNINSSGFFIYDNYIVDIFVVENQEYVEHEGIKFQSNILNAFEKKLEIFENAIKKHNNNAQIEIDITEILYCYKKNKRFENEIKIKKKISNIIISIFKKYFNLSFRISH